MSYNNSKNFRRTLLAASIMAIGSTAYAADEPNNSGSKASDDIEEIVVKGIRRNIESAQELKRNAGTVIDSITADELGDFPDKSVAEAIMRVPGVMIERFATRTDTGAFSVEPSGVVIRGLPFVRSEFNGRDTFSADSSRGLSWGDVSPELMGGVDIYKNQTAELVEGGISGLINLRTRLPFDSDKDMKVLTIADNYSDLSKSSTPEISGIYSTRFDTDVGEFGVMINAAYSDVDATSQRSSIARVNRFRDVYADDSLYYIPQGVGFGDSEYSRQRNGESLALQWQDGEGRFVSTFQYNRSEYKNAADNRSIGASWSGLGNADSLFTEITEDNRPDKIPRAADGTAPFEFSEDGLFAHGTIMQDHGWWGANNTDSASHAVNGNGNALVETCAGTWANCEPGQEVTQYIGANVGTGADISDSKRVTQDYSFNLKWNVSDKLHLNFDAQQVVSDSNEYRIRGDFTTWSNVEVDLRPELNAISLHSPTNVNVLDAGQGVYANPQNYSPSSILEFLGDNHGEEFATKVDVIYDVDSGFVEKIKAGVRYADRDQQVNQAGNWNAIATGWNANANWFSVASPPVSGIYQPSNDPKDDIPYTFNGYKDSWAVESWDSKYGSVSTGDGTNLYIFPNRASMRDWRNTMSVTATGQPINGYNPICSHLGSRSEEVGDTCFLPKESLDVSEVTDAVYVQVDFGGDSLKLFDRPISGNIGVRYIKTDITSSGAEQFPKYLMEDNPCGDTSAPTPDAPPPPVPKTVSCYLSPDDFAFMDNGGNLGTSMVTHHNLLPSLNIKYDVTDKFVTRVALSRAMSRPDIGSLRNYTFISSELPSTDSKNDPLWVKDGSGEIVGANVAYTANAADPFLKPTIADQLDVSFEYYSGPNSVSLALYKKSFKDYIQTGTYIRPMTHNGVTRNVVVTGPVNGDGAEMQGFEVQGTYLLDFLPGIWSGLGVQANYTYVDNKGIKNTGVNSASDSGSSGSSASSDRVQVDQLEGMSKDAYNVSVFFEQGRLSTRLAYNWRSEYLVTVQDCCVGTPIWQEPYGQLDASVRYRINDMFELSLSGSNLTDQKAVLTQQIDNTEDGGKRLKYSTNQSDIRYTLGLRMQF